MNADKMTREEFDSWDGKLNVCAPSGCSKIKEEFWSRIQAIQSAPFVPDWSLKPEKATAFVGHWWYGDVAQGTRAYGGGFFIPAPTNPTDAELSAMWEKLDRDKRVQILRDAGVVV